MTRDIEREQVEWVFGLTGGELDDKPWQVSTMRPPAQNSELLSYAYTYEGTPSYSDLAKDYGHQYRTVVGEFLFDNPSPELFDKDGQRYTLVEQHKSSGEAECPYRQLDPSCDEDEEELKARPCELCEAQEGEGHSYVYLGEGWCEAVYILEEEEEQEEEEEEQEEELS